MYESAHNIITGFLMYNFRKGKPFGSSMVYMYRISCANLISEIMADPEMDEYENIKALLVEYDGKETEACGDSQDIERSETRCKQEKREVTIKKTVIVSAEVMEDEVYINL